MGALRLGVCGFPDRSAEDDVNSIGKPTVAVVTIIVALEDKELPKVENLLVKETQDVSCRGFGD